MVFMAESPPFGHSKNFLDSDTTASNVHEPGSKVRFGMCRAEKMKLDECESGTRLKKRFV